MAKPWPAEPAAPYTYTALPQYVICEPAHDLVGCHVQPYYVFPSDMTPEEIVACLNAKEDSRRDWRVESDGTVSYRTTAVIQKG